MSGDSPAFLVHAFVLVVYFIICAALMQKLSQQAAESI
jgi:hypothetical protein